MKIQTNACRVCSSKTKKVFSKKILGKYTVDYFQCKNCGLIQTEKPYWLKEAYSSAIINSDTGIIFRNNALSKMTSIFMLLLGRRSKVIDYGGGYGLTTRMLRDIGIDCYWTDKYAQNIFAKGFEHKCKNKYDVVTAFELFEHLENPIKEVENITKTYKQKDIIFSTMLHNGKPQGDWWYFVPEGGQHITLYTKKSLEILAKKYGMKLSTNNRSIHIFSKKRIPTVVMNVVSIFWPTISSFTHIFYKSKTFSDYLISAP